MQTRERQAAVGGEGRDIPGAPCPRPPDQARVPPVWGRLDSAGGTLTLQLRKEDASSAAPTADASVLWGGESVGTMLQVRPSHWPGPTRSLALPPASLGRDALGRGLEGALQIHA